MVLADALRTGRPAAATARDNLHSIEMVFAAAEASAVTLDGDGDRPLRIVG